MRGAGMDSQDFLPAESGIAISLFRPETEKAIDPINLVNPV